MGSGAGSGLLLAGLAVAAGALIWMQAWWRGWWRQGTARTAQMIEAQVKPRLLPAQQVDLLGLQRRMVAAGLTAVTVAVTGERRLPSRVSIEVSPDDLRRLATQLDGGLDQVRTDLATEVARRGQQLGYTTPAGLTVDVMGSPFALDGRPRLARPGRRPPAAPDPSPPDVRPTRSDRERSPDPAPERHRREPLEQTALMATRRWAGERTVNLDRASLVPADGGPPRPLAGRRTTVGRRAADLVVDHPSVSAEHAELVCERGRWSVVDRGSTNGTWVNGEQVARRLLADGDLVRFAPDGPAYVFHLRPPAHPGPGAPAGAVGPTGSEPAGGTSAAL